MDTYLSRGHILVTMLHCIHCEARGPARWAQSLTGTWCWAGPGCRAWTEETGWRGRKRVLGRRRRRRRNWWNGRATGAPGGCWEMNPGCRWSEFRNPLQTWCCCRHKLHHSSSPTSLRRIKHTTPLSLTISTPATFTSSATSEDSSATGRHVSGCCCRSHTALLQ